ncbi:MAG TPA: hypothetical protein VEF04_02505, partial [Blastocatellia bacterium]|nr:hypothetical protein [Blastocatellia bacterium]
MTECRKGFERALSGQFALIVIDTSLLQTEAVSIIEFLRQLRTHSLLPVLLIAATDSDTERVLALEFGAD